MVALTRARDGFRWVLGVGLQGKKAFWNRVAATSLSKGKDKDLPHATGNRAGQNKFFCCCCFRGDINLLSADVKLMLEQHKYVSVSARIKQEFNKFGPQHSK